MDPKEQFNHLVGGRVRIAREASQLSQSDLAAKLGLSSHQIVSAIETGIRAVSADEMFELTEIFRKPMEYFTDPYLIVDEKVISYRAELGAPQLEAFEATVNNLVAAAVRFADLTGEEINPLKSQLSVDRSSDLSWIGGLGSQLAQRFELGPIPAENLVSFIEEKLGIMVLKIDAPRGISGAACHLPRIDIIVVNRKEPVFRQHFDLAHELFHVLTWHQLPPERHDWIEEKKSKTEQMADAFAAGLLMPLKAMKARWASRSSGTDLHEWILTSASEMQVSGPAFYWRLVNLGLLPKKVRESVDLNRLSRSNDATAPSLLFGEGFVRRMHAVVDQGKVSARKAAELVGLDRDDLKQVFASYGLHPPF
jgi:XRE family transcriptional regulator, fatty acid utilization regulator